MKYSIDYIVRIYRFEPDDPENLVGTAEIVGDNKIESFKNFDELRQILISNKIISGKGRFE